MTLTEIDRELMEISGFLRQNRQFKNDLELRRRCDLLLDMRAELSKNIALKIKLPKSQKD